MKKGTKVSMHFIDNYIYGVTVEDEATSPTQKEPNRKVIRVKWDDGSESIERVDALILA